MVAVAWVGILALPARAAPAPVLAQTLAAGIAQDAADYARRHGVPVEEAERRIRAQGGSVAETDRIAAAFADRLVGIAIEHEPVYRIVVLLTGSAPVANRTVFAGGMTVPIDFRIGAPFTRDQIVATIQQHQADLRAALSHPPGLGVDPRTGELVVAIDSFDVAAEGRAALTARLAAIAGVPVRLQVVDRIDADAAAPGEAASDFGDGNGGAIEGGSRVEGVNPVDGRRYACTTGFVVTDGMRTGVVTAAHCPDTLDYLDPARQVTPLSFAGQWGWSYQDVQLNLAASAAPLRPFFYADTARTVLRPVTAARRRASTRAGDVVCHRGERTGYSCAEVELVDFAPSGDLCGGPCAPTWVTVAGPTCRGGDSGGPVFAGTTAFGIVKGGSYRADGGCNFYYYMSVDYLPEGWSLLRDASDVGAVAGAAVNPRQR